MGQSSASLKKSDQKDRKGLSLVKDSSAKPNKSKSKKKLPKLLDRAGQEAVILENRDHGRRLAWSFLTNWRIRLDQDEVESVVGAALCEAASRFDPSKEVAFKTFFFYHLRGMLLKEISRMIDDQKTLQAFSYGPSDSMGNEMLMHSNIAAPETADQNPEQVYVKRELTRLCVEACSDLDSLEREVVIRYFLQDEPLISISNQLGYCRCHISRVKSRALKRLEGILTGKMAFELLGVKAKESGPRKESPRKPRASKKADKSYTGGRGRRKSSKSKMNSEPFEELVRAVQNG